MAAWDGQGERGGRRLEFLEWVSFGIFFKSVCFVLVALLPAWRFEFSRLVFHPAQELSHLPRFPSEFGQLPDWTSQAEAAPIHGFSSMLSDSLSLLITIAHGCSWMFIESGRAVWRLGRPAGHHS